MARSLRLEFDGALYHVMARGNARQAIFVDDVDRAAFVANLGRVTGRFDWRVWAWCLMGSHYHLLVETMRPTLSRGVRRSTVSAVRPSRARTLRARNKT
jgi:putative transposase